MEVFNLNIIPGAVAPVIHASQYDEGREFRANLFEGDQVFELTGAETISVNVRKPDGNVVTAAVANTGAAYVEFSTTLQMTACAGANLCQLKIENSPRKIGTLNFILSVERDPLEGGIQSESAIHDLQAQIAEAVADQYDADAVIFDTEPTANHGIGYAVTSEGLKNYIPKNVGDLDDVTITEPAEGEALVFDENGNLVNGTVSTVGNLDDLSDVDTTGKATGDSLRYDGNSWVAKPTTYQIEKADFDQISDFTPYANSHIVVPDEPNLNPDASDIEYSSGVTVKQAIDTANTNISNLTNRNDIKYYDMSVTTVANSYVAPFSAYKSENLPSNLQSKTVLSAQVLSHSATNPTSVQFKDYTIYVYSKSAETFDVRVVYID